jgi:uncharacterized membrane protein YfhO
MGIIIYKLPRTESFMRIVAGVTAAACIITMFAGVNFGAVQDGGHSDYIEYAINGKDNLDMDAIAEKSEVNPVSEDNTFYRIDTSENVDNWCMYWGLSSMRTFHSVVPSSIMEFYESIGQTRDVASRMETNLYALRSLFSVRYYFDRSTDGSVKTAISGLYGFEYVDSQNQFNIYENQYWIPMGFTYDYYTNDDTIQETNANKRPNVILEAAVLDNETLIKYADILQKYDSTTALTTDDHFAEVCEDKRKTACYYFSESSSGFEAKINLESDKLLFFSVPYEDGWTAEVNGEAVDIDKVNYGFMAIRCPAGESDIVFTYKTAGLAEGKIITAVSAGVFVLYIAGSWFYDKKRKPRISEGDGNTDTNSETEDEIPSEKALENLTESDERSDDNVQ